MMKTAYVHIPLIILGILFAATPSLASIIIQDDFSDNEVATPTSRSGSQVWTVASGSFAADGNQVDGNFGEVAGQLNFGTTGGTSIYIDFGNVQANTGATVTLDLRQTNGTTGGYPFGVALIDTSTGNEYKEEASPNPGNYGGVSGFHNRDLSGNIVASDLAAAQNNALGSDGQFDTLEMTFDPTSGVTFSMNGTRMAEWSNYHGITKVDRLQLTNQWGTVSWYVDNVSVDATLIPEPSTLILTLGAIVAGIVFTRRKRK
jgi:hypothetical protein